MPITSYNLSELILTFQFKEQSALERLQSTLRGVIQNYDYRKNKELWKKYLEGLRPCPQYKFLICYFLINKVNYSTALQRNQVFNIIQFIILELPSDYHPLKKVNKLCHEFPQFLCRFDELSAIEDDLYNSWNYFINYFFSHYGFVYPFRHNNLFDIDYFLNKDLSFYTIPVGYHHALLFSFKPHIPEPIRIEIMEEEEVEAEVPFTEVELDILEEEIIYSELERELFADTPSDCIIEDQEMINDFLELIVVN